MAATMLASRGILLRKLNFNTPLIYAYSSSDGKGKKPLESLVNSLFNDKKKLNKNKQVISKKTSENEDEIENSSPPNDIVIEQKIAESNAKFITQEKKAKNQNLKSKNVLAASPELENVLSKFKNKTQTGPKPLALKPKNQQKSESKKDEKKAAILNRMMQMPSETKPKSHKVLFKPVVEDDDLNLSIRETSQPTEEKQQAETQSSFVYYVDKDAPPPEPKPEPETKMESKPVEEIEDYVMPIAEEDTESFATLMRNSKLMQIGAYKSEIVSGTIFNIVEDDMYIDFGGKFHCVCKKPAIENTWSGSSYVLGNTVKVRINDLEMTSKFLGADRHVTILEADATLIGIQRKYKTPSETDSVFIIQSDTTKTKPESNINLSEAFLNEPESVISQTETDK